MQRRFVALFSALVGLSVFLSTVTAAGAAPAQHTPGLYSSAASATGYCASPEEVAFLHLINDYRKANGLGTLTLSQTLGASAEHHSNSMADFEYFDHFLIPEGIGWSQNMTNYGYTYNTYRGENIAGVVATAQLVFNAWKASPGHNANMLNAHYTTIGVGRIYNPKSPYGYYWTTDFGGYRDSAPQLCSQSETSGGITSTIGAYHYTASGRSSNSRSSVYCYDGRQNTSWYTISLDIPRYAYAWFDLGQVKAFSSVKWKFNRTGYADHFEIQVSNDRQSWTTIADGTNAPSDTWQAFNHKASGRYVRFLFRNPNNDPKLGFLSEVRVYP
ncbi:MAG: CAP domain-containing protein [Thermomicrobiales bacterium]